jgi:hypothetical protein
MTKDRSSLRTSDYDLRLKVSPFQPLDRLFQLRITALVSQIAGMDEHVSLGKLGRLAVGIRYADYARFARL